MSAPAKTVSDLQKTTGLKAEYTKECFNAFGGYAAALASFAQSYAVLPASYFDTHDMAAKNAKQINDELRAIYRRAREMKTKSGKTDEAVWKEYGSNGDAASPAGVFSAGTAAPAGFGKAPAANVFGAASAPTAFGAASPTGVFGAGTATPAPGSFGQTAAGFGAPSSATKAAPTGFGFGSAAAATGAAAPASAFSFGSNKASAAANAAPSGLGGLAEPEESADAGEEAKAEKKPVKYCEPTHFTGPYFEMPEFWEAEVVGRAPLLNLNNGFLEANKDGLRARLEKWATKAAFYRHPVKYVAIEDDDEEVVRVIIKDADRTFFEPAHRTKMVAFLNAMYTEFGAYGQAMSYLSGLCMLVLNEAETASILRFVSTEYIRGHWAAEAVGFATSAWVVEFFMKKLYPDVAARLQELNFWPDTYLQKILTGLCIHVLPFEDLFDFLDAFIQGGMRYLIRFSLAIVEHFRSDLLALKSSTEANKLYEIMRLDAHTCDHSDVREILARAPSMDLGEDGASIDLIRSQVYGEKVEPRLKRAPKTATFEPCCECDKNRPIWYNDDLGAVCDKCKNEHPELTFEKY